MSVPLFVLLLQGRAKAVDVAFLEPFGFRK
jgi:hypothetical protein